MADSGKPQSTIGSMANAMSGSTADRRRSSASGGSKFANLENHKRNSTDANAQARKASFAEQSAPVGFIGGMWNKFTKGTK